MSSERKRQALGKGLSALIPAAGKARPGEAAREYFICRIERIHPQPGQPRQRFDEKSLAPLVESIRELGIIQPPAVRRYQCKL